MLASANRDESFQENSEVFNFKTKKKLTCSFGKGKHACIGGYLAIKELVVFVQEFSPLMKNYTIDVSGNELEFEGNVIKMYKNITLEKK